MLQGAYEDKDSPILNDFWASFNMFFEYAKTLSEQAKRAKSLEGDVSKLRNDVTELKERVFQKEGQIETLRQGQPQLNAKSPKPEFDWDWGKLLESARKQMDGLVLSDEIEQRLKGEPFASGIAKGIWDLLEILNSISIETQQDQSLSPRGLLIHQQHFVGRNAAFSDESDTNKRHFKSELTFKDPSDPSSRLFCGWHGKINQGQFRIHFEWPRPAGQRKIKVVYVGLKITKH